MSLTKRVDKQFTAAQEQLRRDWRSFWANFTDAELELMASEPETSIKPEYLALVEKAGRLGYSELDRRSEALGV